MVKKAKRRSKGKGKKEKAPGPFTAAGLVRFYEEADVGIKMKPYTLVILSLAFTIAIIVLSKIYGG
ncbi:MAG: preprotein translocase subunit Sec61beta [Desulfurococcales archaeon ex4484_58]|nr:MAG: preprotein translocase subunit Sec61beta [Desulfurococcales archaeon ex4484_58]